MREIPDDLVETIEKARTIFDELYVVFTDYTGKEERKVEKERRDKDPILFGSFKNQTNVADRFYFLGDWVDEYCDLTLDKLVEQYKEKRDTTPTMTTKIPETTDELIEILKSYKKEDEKKEGVLNELTMYKQKETESRPGFFDKIRSVFTKKHRSNS